MISTGADASLFDLAADPDERDDVSGIQPQQVERMRTLLGTWLERWPPIATGDDGLATLSAEDRATLEALGYLR